MAREAKIYFGRLDRNGDVRVLHLGGNRVTKMSGDARSIAGRPVSEEHLEGLTLRRSDAERLGVEIELLSPFELKLLRERLGLDQRQFAIALGWSPKDDQTIRRYENGGPPIPRLIVHLALMFDRFGVPEDFLTWPR
jgi:DNA-binding transcriptional regulator YiaG